MIVALSRGIATSIVQALFHPGSYFKIAFVQFTTNVIGLIKVSLWIIMGTAMHFEHGFRIFRMSIII